MKKFSKILYKPDGGNWKKIDGSGYDYDLFSIFQKCFLEKNFLKAVENIENGGVEIFPFQNQSFVKNKFLFSSEEGLQELTQIFESSPKIQVSNKSVTFDNEIYDWENYNIEFEIGTITVSDLKKNTILEIEAKNTVICQEILLKKLIEKYCEIEDRNRLIKILEMKDRFLYKYFINEFSKLKIVSKMTKEELEEYQKKIMVNI